MAGFARGGGFGGRVPGAAPTPQMGLTALVNRQAGGAVDRNQRSKDFWADPWGMSSQRVAPGTSPYDIQKMTYPRSGGPNPAEAWNLASLGESYGSMPVTNFPGQYDPRKRG